jgi:hypothetical protein
LHIGGATDESVLTLASGLEHLRGIGHAKLAKPSLLPAPAKVACATCKPSTQGVAAAPECSAGSTAPNSTTSQSGRTERARLADSATANPAAADSTATSKATTANSAAANAAAGPTTAKSRSTATASDLSEDRRSRHERSGDQSRDIAEDVTHRRSRLGLLGQ